MTVEKSRRWITFSAGEIVLLLMVCSSIVDGCNQAGVLKHENEKTKMRMAELESQILLSRQQITRALTLLERTALMERARHGLEQEEDP